MQLSLSFLPKNDKAIHHIAYRRLKDVVAT